MPFTPFHLGPALAVGLPLRERIHAPTFILASIAVDVEPLVVLVLGLDYPLHGYLHTFAGAALLGLCLGLLMHATEKVLGNAWKRALLEGSRSVGFEGFAVAGILGCTVHVLLDSPLYPDIRPLYPYAANPLYDPSLTPAVYLLCSVLLLGGLAYYLYLALQHQAKQGLAR
ncbi:hypothetical protein [Thermofilum pendens]|uniref:Hydrolase n=1 Tax=Thermofilum pendens (strain DSM 2475 / Hrk 5) TaxID=368408 RepID=A1S0F6_THEPD|nr:hypothetical protein [Thermofilum pendens]ABL78936.1 conserved hypothetical protein [Thermofilum pendens Hrk 5]